MKKGRRAEISARRDRNCVGGNYFCLMSGLFMTHGGELLIHSSELSCVVLLYGLKAGRLMLLQIRAKKHP
jgi:hypothetical protein